MNEIEINMNAFSSFFLCFRQFDRDGEPLGLQRQITKTMDSLFLIHEPNLKLANGLNFCLSNSKVKSDAIVVIQFPCSTIF